MTIQSASKLWRALSKHAGLDIKRYDEQLVVELADKLRISANNFAKELDRPEVTVERLVEAFLTVLQPYAGMMQEILAFFAKIGAATSGESLRIRFEFDKLGEHFEFDLRNFREWERQFVEKTARLHQDELDELHLGQIRAAFVEQDITYRIVDGQWRDIYPSDPMVAQWLKVQSEHQPRVIPAPSFRSQRLQTFIERVWAALPRMSADDAHTIVRGAYLLKNEEDKLLQRLQGIFGNVRSREVETKARIELLFELLRLPVWNRRSEVYSIWLGARLIQTLGPEARVHVIDHSIVFAFGGAHLATVNLPSRENLQVWCERQTRVAKVVGKGRKHSIQPDYSILREPISHPESAILVVECKQYLKQNRRGFASALIDYTNGHRKAIVVLASYGPTNTSIVDDVRKEPGELDLRTRVIGMLRPGSAEAIMEFEALVSSIVPASKPVPAKPRTAALGDERSTGSLRLSWESDADLDLHAWLRQANDSKHIYYGRATAGIGGATVTLDRDVRTGGDCETLTWELTPGVALEIAVNAFAGRFDVANPRIEAIVSGRRLIIEPPVDLGEWWTLLRIEDVGSLLHVINSSRKAISLQQD